MKAGAYLLMIFQLFGCRIADYSVEELIEKEDFERADQILDSLLRIEKTSDVAQLYRDKAFTSMKLNNLDTALSYYLSYLAIEPTDAKAWNNLGHIYTQKENYSFALKSFSNAVELNPNDPVPLLNKARAQYNLERYSDALKSMNVAKRKGMYFGDSDKLILASVHYNMNQISLAQEKYDELDIHNFGPSEFEEYFIISLRLENIAKAKNILFQALQQFPDEPICLNMASFFYSEVETDLESAYAYTVKSIEKDSNCFNLAYQNRCLVHIRSGKVNECCKILDTLIACNVTIYPELIEACEE